MRANYLLWIILTVFYAVVTAGYHLWWSLTHDGWEPIGTSALAMLTFMSAFLAFYLWKTANTQGEVPEDRLDANIEDGESEIGFYSPWSWWPFYLGLTAALAFASLAIGWWVTFIAVPLGIVGIIGYVFEHSRGQFAH
ncbi:unannotated protein [freshwater metagenome]|uniref:Unannotated protein n=1 Tax=freshwater metagenome TaxID=449393 RepID=A0A6J6IQK2_9ZZZZ|nr:cytochrome c oxidase subunit 4 [Actinomycetota bacterium]